MKYLTRNHINVNFSDIWIAAYGVHKHVVINFLSQCPRRHFFFIDRKSTQILFTIPPQLLFLHLIVTIPGPAQIDTGLLAVIKILAI